jgi:hypothetical protein
LRDFHAGQLRIGAIGQEDIGGCPCRKPHPAGG